MTRRWSSLARKAGHVRAAAHAAESSYLLRLSAPWGYDLADTYAVEARWWIRWAPWWPA